MKLYITKPKHTRYGQIKMKRYESIDDLYADCTIWFKKPSFQKPSLCMFTQELMWPGFEAGYHASGIKFSNWLSIPALNTINNVIKEIIKSSLNDDLTDKLTCKHYKWVESIDVKIDVFDESVNQDKLAISLFLIKPEAGSIAVAGIDRCLIFFSKPKLIRRYYANYTNPAGYYYDLHTDKSDVLSGWLFRKVKEFDDLGKLMWKSILESYTVDCEDMNFFYRNINEKNHKKGQSSKKFVKEFKIIMTLEKED